MTEKPITRRTLITGAAVAASGALLSNLPAGAQQGTPQAPAAPPPVPADPTKVPGTPTTAVGSRSSFVSPQRAPVGEITGTAFTPLQALSGTITPADLHFTRIHAGVP